jgi:hypothetical protein
MKSVRLEPALEARLKRAAEKIGSTESEVIRAAVGERVDAILGGRVAEGWAAFVGKVDGGRRGRARDAHQRFTELLQERQATRGERASKRQRS